MKKFEIIFPVLKKCWPVFLVAVGLIELIVLYLFNDSLPLHHKYQIGMAFALLLHIFEEEFFPGGFGFSFNTVKNPKDYSDCYPMNPMISMTVNFLGVLFLTISAFFPSLYFLGIGVAVFWGLEVMIHTVLAFLPRAKGLPLYSPGLLTAWLAGGFCAYRYLHTVISENLLSGYDWALGIVYLFAGIILVIRIPEDRLSDKNSPFRYENDREFYGFFYRYIKQRYQLK
ncbi:HXXEE domain-containing protein [Neisseria oralis]|uniref:HXXEE domain-containing protein n=1 Tax=Neisseria oralis TaxID=1107316 RepID=A0ABW8Q7M2_9NEIS|nr:HXXEE domain-containing protein [uncultured Neisseria sp.]